MAEWLQYMLTNEGFRVYIYSGDFQLIYILLILMIIDVVTGMSKAAINKNLWSRKSLLGFARKILVFFIITVANLMDLFLSMDGVLVLATVGFYIMNEILSILENSAQVGLPIPDKIKEVLEVVQQQDNIKAPAEKMFDDRNMENEDYLKEKDKHD